MPFDWNDEDAAAAYQKDPILRDPEDLRWDEMGLQEPKETPLLFVSVGLGNRPQHHFEKFVAIHKDDGLSLITDMKAPDGNPIIWTRKELIDRMHRLGFLITPYEVEK